MVFFVTTIDNQGQERSFSYQIDQIETGLDVLSTLVAQGNTLVEVRLYEEGHSTTLPAEAFDGKPVSLALQELENQWHTLLSEPILSSSANDKSHLDWAWQLVEFYELRVTHYELMLTRLAWLLQDTHVSKLPTLAKSVLVDKYTRTIQGYEHILSNTRSSHRNVLDTVNRLTTEMTSPVKPRNH